jgi:hypothetical protein
VRFSVEEPVTVVYRPCGLVEEGVYHRSFTTFFDKDGNETHTLQQAPFDAVITNPATGETFRDRGHVTVRRTGIRKRDHAWRDYFCLPCSR